MSINLFCKLTFIFFQICINIIIQVFPSLKYLKYILIFLCFLPIFVLVIVNNRAYRKTNFAKQVFLMLFLCFALSFVSVYTMIKRGVYNFSFAKECLFTILPVMAVWAFVGYEKDVDFNFYIDTFFIFTVINFFIRYYKIFSVDNILSVSFMDSYSVFESELVNIFLSTTFYYLFVNKRLLKAVVSSVFCWLSMKRIHELFLLFYWVVFFIIKIFPSIKTWLFVKKVGFVFEALLCVVLILFPLLLNYGLCSDVLNNLTQKYLHLSFNAFTLGRENMYKLVYENLDKVVGWGDTRPLCLSLWGGNDMHSDFLRVFYETGYIGLIVFAFMYIKMCDRNLLAMLFFGFVICVMLISPIITDVFGMTCIYFVLYSTICKNKNQSKNGEKLY